MQARDVQRISAVLVLSFLLGGVPIPGVSEGSSLPALTGVHHTVASDRTRVVLDLSSQSGYEVRSFKNPDRVAVNLRDVRASKTLPSTDIPEGIVKKIRINRLSWGTQVVFDLRRAADWSDLYLQPVDGMPGRIVIDVLGPNGADGVAAAPAGAESPPAAVPAESRPAAASEGRVPSRRPWIIAVDAGHGGKDWGTKGRYDLVEKTLVLDIARRVGRSLDGTDGFKAVLIRDGDYFLDLVERTKLAKKKGADVFVSVHLNSAPRKSARGVEVWFISPAGADAAAKRLLSNGETAARELGIDEPQSSDILHMLVNVNQQAMMQRSFLLAEEILKATNRKGLPPVRSVKQQSFAVLKSIDMPSVLVEAGFLTNISDAKFMKTAEGRQAAADAIAAGVVSFFKKYPPPETRGSTIAKKVHKVKKGETLWAISKKYNTTVASIRSSNGLRESDVLLVGQELLIRENHDGR